MRDEMIENIRRLSDLLEAETKRLQTANTERDRWLNEANRLEQECAQLRRQLETTPLQKGDSMEMSELRLKVAELMDENAKLAGDLLKLETGTNDYAINEEQSRWTREKAALEAQIQELKKQSNGSITNGYFFLTR
jgi:chromosome segregation ATPase